MNPTGSYLAETLEAMTPPQRFQTVANLAQSLTGFPDPSDAAALLAAVAAEVVLANAADPDNPANYRRTPR